MLRVKGSDTCGPLGPGLVTGWELRGKDIETRVNGDIRQAGNTDEMIWECVPGPDIARTITLRSEVVCRARRPTLVRVEPGDVVEVEVEGLGTLRNTIVEGDVAIRRRRRAAELVRRGRVDRVRRRLGAPRDPAARENLTRGMLAFGWI